MNKIISSGRNQAIVDLSGKPGPKPQGRPYEESHGQATGLLQSPTDPPVDLIPECLTSRPARVMYQTLCLAESNQRYAKSVGELAKKVGETDKVTLTEELREELADLCQILRLLLKLEAL